MHRTNKEKTNFKLIIEPAFFPNTCYKKQRVIKLKVIMYWYWINVFNNDSFVGSFYTDGSKRNEIIEKINNKYGKGNWNRFTCEQ